MSLRLRYEARRAGPIGWGAPLAAMVVTSGLAVLASGGGAAAHQVDHLVMAGLEVVLSLAVGVAAIAVVARESCRELHLSLPVWYGGTLARRVGVMAGWAVGWAAGGWGVLAATGRWGGPAGVSGALVWLAPLVWLGAVGIVAVLLSRSVALATSVVAGVWLVELLFSGQLMSHPVGRALFLFTTTMVGHGDGWLANRLWLLGSGVVLLGVAGALLAWPQRLLAGEED